MDFTPAHEEFIKAAAASLYSGKFYIYIARCSATTYSGRRLSMMKILLGDADTVSSIMFREYLQPESDSSLIDTFLDCIIRSRNDFEP